MKTALITGAATGIGASIVRRATADGYRTLFTDIDESAGGALARDTGAEFIACDMGDDKKVEAMVKGVGAVWLLVNNVGIAGPHARLEHLTTDEWRRTFDVNLVSHFVACREMVPLMRAQGGGRIVNLASAGALIPYVDRVAYAASKRGLLALTSTLAWEVGRDRITVNALLPGVTQGERLTTLMPRYAKARGISEEAALGEYLVRQATGRVVDPEDLAAMVMYLAGPHASSITGQSISVDGGFH
jgi:NAD(P)-dependent dehydrogenase (short-subunit alcohol dehydrogenase family)